MPPIQRRSTHFRDGVSRIDYVLVQKRNKSEALRLQNYRFVSNLKEIGLKVEREKGVQYDDLIFIKLHVPDVVLKRIAAIHGVICFYENDKSVPNYNNHWSMFKTKITKKPNKQDPVFQRSSRSVRGEICVTFTNAERIMLTHYLLQRTKFGDLLEEYGLDNLLENKNFEDAYPLHDGKWEWDDSGPLNDRQILFRYWASWKNVYKQQPLHIINKYYGPEIGYHFAWLGFYTKSLIPIAILGVLVFIISIVALFTGYENDRVSEVCTSNVYVCPACFTNVCLPTPLRRHCQDAIVTFICDNMYTVIFAIIVTNWATVFLELWTRNEYKLRYRWNLNKVTAVIDELPAFKQQTANYTRLNKYTGVKEQYYPTKLAMRQYAISSAFCLLAILLVIFTVLFIRVTMEMLKYVLFKSSDRKYHQLLELGTKCYSGLATVLCIKLYFPLFNKIARKLTDKEVHRTHRQYLNSYILKSYIMQFFNTYTNLFYNAFFKNIDYTHPGAIEHYRKTFGFGSDACPPSVGCTAALALHVIFIMLKNYLMMFMDKGRLLPLAIKMLKKSYAEKKGKGLPHYDPKHLPQWEIDYDLEKPTRMFFLKSFMHHIMEYGVVIFFVAAMPLLPILALFNNIIQMRMAASSLVKRIRRNVPNRVTGLGAWKTVLMIVTRISYVVSGCVIAFSSKFTHRIMYDWEHGNLTGFVNDTLSVFNPEDFSTEMKIHIYEQFPNITECYYSGNRVPYGEPRQYQPSDKHYKILAGQMVVLVIFVHVVFFMNHIIMFLIPNCPAIIKEYLAYDEKMQLAKNIEKTNVEVTEILKKKRSARKEN